MTITRQKRIYNLLQDALDPDHLEVINDSDKHSGHAGSPGTGESHYKLKIQARALCDMNRIQAHRHIYNILDKEIKNGIHSISINIIK